ncbi:hypothetical protein ACOMHN_001290 [Nucella lapillus]
MFIVMCDPGNDVMTHADFHAPLPDSDLTAIDIRKNEIHLYTGTTNCVMLLTLNGVKNQRGEEEVNALDCPSTWPAVSTTGAVIRGQPSAPQGQ